MEVDRGRTAGRVARRLRQAGAAEWGLLLRTFGLLLAAKAALRWLPVKKVIGWKQRRVNRPVAPTAEDLRRTRRAVLVVARYAPMRFVCFPQCLAAGELLRARGIESRLHYGIAREGKDGKLITHTWLEAGGEIVIGGEVAGDYSTLAVY